MTAIHKTEVLTRSLKAPVSRVFAAWADPEARLSWGTPGPSIELKHSATDFSEGGQDIALCVADGAQVAEVYTRYIDIRTDARIVMSEVIEGGGTRFGASLVTAEFEAEGEGCRLVVTLQTVALDGSGLEADVIEGWTSALEMLERFVAAPVQSVSRLT